MARPTKFNGLIKYELIELYSKGLSISACADLIGVSSRTIDHWIKKYELRPILDKAREDSAKDCIEVGLRKLASGVESETIKEKFTYIRTAKRIDKETGEEIEYIQPVEKTIVKDKRVPDVKAIEVLARKYYKEFDSKSEERDLTSKILEGFTMRDLQESLKSNPIDAISLDPSNYSPVEEE